MKVRVGDVVTCSEEEWATGLGERLAKMHVDFVLVRPRSGLVVAGVELDDRSHRLLARRRRDRFLNEVFRSAWLPLLRFRAVQRYDVDRIRWAIERVERGWGVPGAENADGMDAHQDAVLQEPEREMLRE